MVDTCIVLIACPKPSSRDGEVLILQHMHSLYAGCLIMCVITLIMRIHELPKGHDNTLDASVMEVHKRHLLYAQLNCISMQKESACIRIP